MRKIFTVVLVTLIFPSLLLAAPRLKNGIDSNEYKNPVDGSTKTFAVMSPYGLTHQTWTIEPVDSEKHTLIVRYVESGNEDKTFFIEDEEGVKYIGYGPSMRNGTPVDDSPFLFDHPVLTFPKKVVQSGYSWGDAYYDQNFTTQTATYTILGTEDVTVSFGNDEFKVYENCLKIMRVRSTAVDQVAWYAKGIGMVKFIYSGRNWDYSTVGYLESITP